LARNASGRDNPANAFAALRPASLGAVEIDQMEKGGALLDPPASHGGGIGAEDGFLAVIALPQPNALAATEVDGRKDQHGCPTYSHETRTANGPHSERAAVASTGKRAV
jgi:hypothetical protein